VPNGGSHGGDGGQGGSVVCRKNGRQQLARLVLIAFGEPRADRRAAGRIRQKKKKSKKIKTKQKQKQMAKAP